MIRNVCIVVGLILLMTGCERKKHFISDGEYRRMVEYDFEQKKQMLADAPEDLFVVFNRPLTLEEKEALAFLYAYSPFIDLTEYGGDFLLENVRASFKARAEMPWGKEIPEAIFRHFVLPLRGSNESLDSSRVVFYEELKDRVKHCKTMEEAALEVNHWCHEKVIYKPTNARTCSPLTMTTTTYGRCGEEAVFALAAMRSVGIPARQVYTPRWSHCDDNHAWIEVWVDGKWKYLGACEPEPRLNIAWFTAPVRRGLFMQARVFGKYISEEEVVSVSPNQTNVNVTGNYTDVKKVVVKVRDVQGEAVPQARVEYKIYNYGEYYPAVVLPTDERGISALTVGLGDWLVWASKDGKYGFAELEAASMDTATLVLDKAEGAVYCCEYDMVPPVEKEYQALVADEERALNDKRFMYEDSVRNAYIATFMPEDEARAQAKEWGCNEGLWVKYIKSARGNYAQLVDFMRYVNQHQKEKTGLAMKLLDVLAEKDLQDITADVLKEHLEQAAVYMRQPALPAYSLDSYTYSELYKNYILNPRVKNEMITAFRLPLKEYLKQNRIASVKDLLECMKKIKVIDSVNTVGVATPPAAVLKAMVTDTRSKELFFVAACRTIGVAARLNPMDGKPEYNNGSQWNPVVFAKQQTIGPKGWVMLHYEGKTLKDPAYYTHFTISRVSQGRTQLIDLGSNSDVDMGGGALYSKIFHMPVELEVGDYILVTGNRRSDGSVLTTMMAFSVAENETTQVDMKIREAAETLTVLGKIDTAIPYVSEDGEKTCFLQLPEQGYTALALIGVNQEPTNHLVRDMSNMKADFEAKGIPMYFLFPDRGQMQKFARHDFKPLPENMVLGYDPEGKLLAMATRCLDLKNSGNLPLILMVNKSGDVVFISQGYRVGLGTQIIKFIK